MWKRLKRLWRHRWLDEDDLSRVLPAAALERLGQRVAQGERGHTGQVRIHAEAGLPWSYLWREASPRERALTLFGKLGVWDTEANNGVLIYLLLAERAIEVVTDRGLTRAVPQDVWPMLVSQMRGAFREGRFEDGLQHAVDEVSLLLVRHFPLPEDRQRSNELPDAPLIGED